MYKSEVSLINKKGQRKYLNKEERMRFYVCTFSCKQDQKLFCQILYFTGARIAEVFNLKPGSIDFSNKTVVFETLKRRKKGVFREILLPTFLLDELRIYIDENLSNANEDQRLWLFSLRTASRYVKRVMLKAEISGVQSSAKGLRHGFAVHAISEAHITKVKKWLGHTKLESTEIYLNVVGFEERKIAQRLWEAELEWNAMH